MTEQTETPKEDAAPVAAEVTARLNGEEHRFSCAAGDTLLDAALDAGVPAPCSCCEGHCGTCMVQLVEGTVIMEGALALSRRDKARGLILACQAVPTAPKIVLEYDW
ncbi:2Fe-2S iron-sulfur cluster binding domain-containing protein [Methyloligella sp. 2.7D]|uniref:2Fe-2S iron-sulfur cluster-binding protein n=1 Tax=unclassified Methyloligella TaxID=2625955 RepID=UPI00157D9FE0|nr:2Fe-2S iron-sulfur cluster binding domain-containing protein [Methyloligella sp. GL2]QKP77106.1 2Fe-2S iron-sulfur cluster binding domain-containing protein [Methyloligella sp. GL2]